MKADPVQVNRLLKTARGQLDGILKMVEEDRYCMDISNQLLATISILSRANREILRAHMEACIRSAFEEGSEEDKTQKTQEILTLLDKLAQP